MSKAAAKQEPKTEEAPPKATTPDEWMAQQDADLKPRAELASDTPPKVRPEPVVDQKKTVSVPLWAAYTLAYPHSRNSGQTDMATNALREVVGPYLG